MFEVRFCIMFREDGLDLEGVIKDLNKYGTVTGVEDNALGDEKVKLIFVTSDMPAFLRVKREYNCVTADDNRYFLIPMASLEDAMIVRKAQRDRAKMS